MHLDQGQRDQFVEERRRRAGLLRQLQHRFEAALAVDEQQHGAVALAQLARAKAQLLLPERGLGGWGSQGACGVSRAGRIVARPAAHSHPRNPPASIAAELTFT